MTGPAQELFEALTELKRLIKLCKKNRYSLSSHPRYSDQARQALAAFRKAFLMLQRNYPPDRFGGVAYQLATIAPMIDGVVGSFPSDSSGMLAMLDDASVKVQADLAVELEAADTSLATVRSVSFLPAELISARHAVLAKVLWEVNRSYDTGCYNSAGAMTRRLIESLIIEGYANLKKEDRISSNGEFHTFEKLIGIAAAEATLGLSREAKRVLPDLKFLGDMGAHNRNALVRKDDLDRVHNALRIAVEEFARHLA